MTLVAGRMPGLHPYGEDGNMQGILKSSPACKFNVSKQSEHSQRNEDGKRLVRFCESDENEKQETSEREIAEDDNQDVIMFGNMYIINKSDPNSAVRKLFPNSKLTTPINPFVNKSLINNSNDAQPTKCIENNRLTFNRTKGKNNFEDVNSGNLARRKIDKNIIRRNFQKVAPETKPNSRKTNEASTPLIERIKQLTCDNEANEDRSIDKGLAKFDVTNRNNISHESYKYFNFQEPTNLSQFQENIKDLPKQAKEGLNLMRYNQNVLQIRSKQSPEKKIVPSNKTSPTDEARRSFLSTLSENSQGDPGDRTSVATSSTTADTVYSLSDIEEALTEEEKEIKEAFSQQNKQDELELFVQQDAGRTERLRKRYSSTPKLESSQPVVFSNTISPPINANLHIPYFTNASCNIKKDKPKFGSTIEILQQLQQQIEIPYQLEGRRTACSNYSDSSIPISERLFYDESSDGYEPVLPKLNVHRTCSLDSKNYEEIENFPSAFSVPRTKSHEHPRLTHIETDPYFYPSASGRYPGNFTGRCQPLEQNIYASSPDLHGYHHAMFPDRVSSYNSHPVSPRQLHPVLQRQYCRYPVNEMPPRPAEEGKILTPPVRMHTYMNVPTNAPCYPSPPPYSKVNHYISSPVHPDMYHYEPPHTHSNIYQNIPLPTNPHMMTIRRLHTERERGVPEGASSSHDSSELYYNTHTATVPKSSSLLHHYCVDV